MISCFPRSLAFSLVEVTLALGVAAISLLAIFGLLATGSQTNHTATEQTAATNILTAVAADLRATPASNAQSLQFGISIPPNPVTTGPGTVLFFGSMGQFSNSLTPTSRYRLVLTYLTNGSGRAATLADLRMTWPAAANPADANTSATEIFLAMDRN